MALIGALAAVGVLSAASDASATAEPPVVTGNNLTVTSDAAGDTIIDVEPDIRIRYRRSEPPPPVSYAIVLESRESGEWTTVRLWDNADVVDEHHEHEYTRAGGEQSPVVLAFDSVNEAMAAAIRKAKTEAPEIVRQWRES